MLCSRRSSVMYCVRKQTVLWRIFECFISGDVRQRYLIIRVVSLHSWGMWKPALRGRLVLYFHGLFCCVDFSGALNLSSARTLYAVCMAIMMFVTIG